MRSTPTHAEKTIIGRSAKCHILHAALRNRRQFGWKTRKAQRKRSDGAKLKPFTTWNWTGKRTTYRVSNTGTDTREVGLGRAPARLARISANVRIESDSGEKRLKPNGLLTRAKPAQQSKHKRFAIMRSSPDRARLRSESSGSWWCIDLKARRLPIRNSEQ